MSIKQVDYKAKRQQNDAQYQTHKEQQRNREKCDEMRNKILPFIFYNHITQSTGTHIDL